MEKWLRSFLPLTSCMTWIRKMSLVALVASTALQSLAPLSSLLVDRAVPHPRLPAVHYSLLAATRAGEEGGDGTRGIKLAGWKQVVKHFNLET